MGNENDEGSILGGLISHKTGETESAWEKIKDDVTYVAQVVQRYRVTKDAFHRQDCSSIPKNEREKFNKTIERMNKVVGEHDEMGLLENTEILRRFEEACWGKKSGLPSKKDSKRRPEPGVAYANLIF